MNKPPLVIKKLRKTYGKTLALDDLDFSLEEGEIFGLLGPNGAGKTTSLSIISGIEIPDAGTAYVCGYDILVYPILAKKTMGIVPQEIAANGFFTVLEDLHYISGFFGIANNDIWITFLLKKLELYEHRHKKCNHLSGGMKRRFMIAKALVHKPRLLFLDEPTAGVDVELRATLWEFILELNQQGTTIFLTTHYLQEAQKLCNRIGVIGKGKLLRLDYTQKLIEELTHRKSTIFLKQPVAPINNSFVLEQKKNKVVFKNRKEMDFGSLLIQSGITLDNIQDIQVVEGTLEDAFHTILGEGL